MWLRMGSFGPVRVRPPNGDDHRSAALPARREPVQPARSHRPRLHRHAGKRVRPHHRRRQAQRFLGRRSGRRRVRAVHPALPHQLQPLELAAVSLRRIVRHDALVGARERTCKTKASRSTASCCSRRSSIEHRLQRRRADRRRRLGLRPLSADRSRDGVVSSRRSARRPLERAARRGRRISRSANTSTRSVRARSSRPTVTTTSSQSCIGTPGSPSNTSATRTCAFRTTGSKTSCLRQRGMTVGRIDARFQTYVLDRPEVSPDWDATDAAIDSAFVSTAQLLSAAGAQVQHAAALPRRDLRSRSTPTASRGISSTAATRRSQRHARPRAGDDVQPAAEDLLGQRILRFRDAVLRDGLRAHHLYLAPALQRNITYGFYQSGHMVYLHPAALAQFHDDLERWYARCSPML